MIINLMQEFFKDNENTQEKTKKNYTAEIQKEIEKKETEIIEIQKELAILSAIPTTTLNTATIKIGSNNLKKLKEEISALQNTTTQETTINEQENKKEIQEKLQKLALAKKNYTDELLSQEAEEINVSLSNYKLVLRMLSMGNIIEAYNKYKSSIIVSIDSLREDKSVNKLAERFGTYPLEPWLLLMNPSIAGEEDSKDDEVRETDTDKKPDQPAKATTFVHALFEANRPMELILEYFKYVQKVIGSNIELSLSYTTLYNQEGVSISDLLKTKQKTQNYSGIYSQAMICFPSGFSASEKETKTIVETVEEPIKKSAHKSLVKLANKYLPSEYIDSTQTFSIKIIRNDELNCFIRDTLHNLTQCITSINEKTDAELSFFIGAHNNQALEKFKFQITKALAFIKFVQSGKSLNAGGEHPFDSKMIQPCGITAQEILAISYYALNDNSAWGNQYEENKNGYLCGFIKAIYVAMRGRNVDDFEEDLDFLEHQSDPDEIKCNEGVVNQVVQGLLDHNDIELRIINVSTMSRDLSSNILEVFKDLATHKAKSEALSNLSIINSWISTGVITSRLSDLIRQSIYSKKYNFTDYSESEIRKYFKHSMTTLDRKFIKEKIKNDPELAKIFNFKGASLSSFALDAKKGYIPFIEYNLNNLQSTTMSSWLRDPNDYDKDDREGSAFILRFKYSKYEEDRKKESLLVTELALNSNDHDYVGLLVRTIKQQIISLSKDAFQINITYFAEAGLNNLFIACYTSERITNYKELFNLAIKAGNIEIVNFLVKKYPNLREHSPLSREAIKEILKELKIPERKEILKIFKTTEAPEVQEVQEIKNILENAFSNNHLEIIKYFIELNNNNIEIIFQEYHNLMKNAVLQDYVAIIKYLLAVKDPRICIEYNEILDIAIEKNHILIVKYLIETMRDQQISIEYNVILKTTVEKNNFHIMKYLIETMRNQQISIEFYEILILAIEKGHLNIVKYLFTLGIKANNDIFQENNSLFDFAIKMSNIDIVKYLFEQYPNNIADFSYNNQTIFEIAIKYKKIDLVKFLLDSEKFSINDDNIFSITNIAIQREDFYFAFKFLTIDIFNQLENNTKYEILNFMLSHNNPILPDYLDILMAHNTDNILINKILDNSVSNDNVDIIIMILKKYVNIDIDHIIKLRIFEHATISGRKDLLEIILKKLDDFSNLTFNTRIPLDIEDEIHAKLSILEIAVLNNNQEIVVYLFDNGFKLFDKEEGQITALYLAVKNDNIMIVEILIKNGANLSHKYEEKTVLELAFEKQKLQIANLLLENTTDFEPLIACIDIEFPRNNNITCKKILTKLYEIKRNHEIKCNHENLEEDEEAILDKLQQSLVMFFNQDNTPRYYNIIKTIIMSDIYINIENQHKVPFARLAFENLSLLDFRNLFDSMKEDNIKINTQDIEDKAQELLHDAFIANKERDITNILHTLPHLVNLQNEDGVTILHRAVAQNKDMIVNALLSLDNIDLTLVAGERKETALDRARDKKSFKIIAAIERKMREIERNKQQTWVEKTKPQDAGNREL
jgi:ankyrin repeat protein